MKRNFGSKAVIGGMTVLAAAFSANSFAAQATASASATVVTPIAITKAADLSFGKLSAHTGGTVVINPAGARSKTGSVVLLSGNAGGAAAFTVSGDANATYAITLPTSMQATRSGGAETMVVDNFTSNPSTTGTLSAGGSQTVSVGATLNVGTGQAVGSYAGNFDVAVEYN